jgi:AbrB family looped-hinge helix DNA binding protein
MTEKLTVDADGKIVIPPEVIQKRGLHPGDELTLIESAEGLLVYHGGVDEIFRRGGTDSTKGSACSHKMMLYARRI